MTPANQLRADCLSLLTCAPLVPCAKEEACCRVARAMLALLPDPVVDEVVRNDESEVAHYAVDWSAT